MPCFSETDLYTNSANQVALADPNNGTDHTANSSDHHGSFTCSDHRSKPAAKSVSHQLTDYGAHEITKPGTNSDYEPCPYNDGDN